MGVIRDVSWGLAAVVVFVSVPARAQAPTNDRVAAEALFEEGRKLAADGKYAAACPKFADSERLDPSPATLLNLASCWERAGHTATAWATYREAASTANAIGRKDYLTVAQRHADALEPGLSRLTLDVATPVEGIEVLRDGQRIDPAQWGAAIPIDPGPHTLTARAPSFKSWESTFEVTPGGSHLHVAVPPLVRVPSSIASAGPAPAVAPLPDASPRQPAPQPGGHRGAGAGFTAVWVLGGLGVVGLAVGTGFAIAAKDKYDSSIKGCEPGNPNLCYPQGLSERSDARSAGDVATVAFSIGAAAIAGGAVLLLTAPRRASDAAALPTLEVAPMMNGAMLRGSF